LLHQANRKWDRLISAGQKGDADAERLVDFATRLVRRFQTVREYQDIVANLGCCGDWGTHTATALLLRALDHHQITLAVTQAAIGSAFDSESLLNAIRV
jgi:hypothetical protein